MNDFWLILLIGALISVLIAYGLFKIWPKFGKMGINTKTVHCPKCGLKAPRIRKPANLREAIWGGWTCKECQCQFDKYGNPIKF